MTGSARPCLGWGGIAIVAAALLLRLYYVDVAEVDNPLRADAGQYFRIALNVVQHGTFSTARPGMADIQPDSYRAPGYPAVIAALLWLCDGDVPRTYYVLLLLQCVLGTATVALALSLAMQIMQRPYAYTAGVLVAVWPHLITFCGYALIENLFGFLMVLAAWSFVGIFGGGKMATAKAAVVFGLAALVNQIAAALSLLLGIWLWVARGRRAACLFVGLALAMPLLWAVRDAQIHAPSGLTAGSRLMENVLIGMEPDFGLYYANRNDPRGLVARQWVGQEVRKFNLDRAAAMRDVWSRMSETPWAYAVWYLSKPAQFWTWSIVQGEGDVYVYPMRFAPFHDVWLLRLIASLCRGINAPLMLAALAGAIIVLVKARSAEAKWRCAAGTVLLIAFFATSLHTILAPDARYAVPFRPFEIILAMLAVCTSVEWALAQRMKQRIP